MLLRLAALVLSASLSGAVLASDVALLIGVGEYRDPRNNLPGIDLDVTNMKQVARSLGFQDIRTLEDEQATASAIKSAMASLARSTSRDDRVLIYFSGHGSQTKDLNGDEIDGLDEFWVAHDFGMRNGRMTGAVIDDDINQALGRIPSRNVYVIVDACQSGTSTKSVAPFLGVTTAQPKFLKYRGMPATAGSASRGIAIEEANSSDNFVAISAAGDTEYALAGAKGSYFTLGIMASVRELMAKGASNVTPKRLHQESVRFVHAKTRPNNRFTPVLSGSSQLASRSIGLNKTEDRGEYWQELERLVRTINNPIRVTADKARYAAGEEIVMTVEIPRSGHLSIITTDANGTPQLLFPNGFMKDSYVQRGVFSTRDLPFDLKAARPFGANLTIAVVTPEPLDLYSNSTLGRNSKGEVLDAIVGLDAAGIKALRSRAITVTASSNGNNRPTTNSSPTGAVWAGKVVTRVDR